MTREETLVVMAMLGLSREGAQKWTPNDKDQVVTLNLGVPCSTGRAEVLKTEKKVTVRAAPTIAGATLGFWVPGPGYEFWGTYKSSTDARDWCLLTGHNLEGWCAGQYVRRL